MNHETTLGAEWEVRNHPDEWTILTKNDLEEMLEALK